MKYNYSEFQHAIKNLQWSKQELADRLSVIGHETEVTGEELDVTVTSNRKDCQNFQYLVFDLCGVTEELEQSNPPSGYSHSNVIPVSIEQVNRLLGSNLEPSVLKKLKNSALLSKQTAFDRQILELVSKRLLILLKRFYELSVLRLSRSKNCQRPTSKYRQTTKSS